MSSNQFPWGRLVGDAIAVCCIAVLGYWLLSSRSDLEKSRKSVASAESAFDLIYADYGACQERICQLEESLRACSTHVQEMRKPVSTKRMQAAPVAAVKTDLSQMPMPTCEPQVYPPCTGDLVRPWMCWAGPGKGTLAPGGLTLPFTYVLHEESCHAPAVLLQCKRGQCKTREWIGASRVFFLDWDFPYVIGDVNGDGIIDVDDILRMQDAFVYGTVETVMEDVCPVGGGNGTIDVDDIMAVIRTFQGLEPPCPPE